MFLYSLKLIRRSTVLCLVLFVQTLCSLQCKLPKHLLLQIFPKQKNGHHPQGGAHFLFDSFG